MTGSEIFFLLILVAFVAGGIELYRTRNDAPSEAPAAGDADKAQGIKAENCIMAGLFMLFANIALSGICAESSAFWWLSNSLFFSLCASSVLGLVPAVLAYRKGRGFVTWWFYGWLLFPIALVHALLLSEDERAVAARRHLRQCPYCAEYIRAEARVCRYCGRELVEEQPAEEH